ncbi:unnamed protein product [Mytilus edulis]|uniref:Thyroglobulin type-1 domain-containing protein n=1 Tax=Mytilus edulis TaxID=6550 RepID=A0A8S3RXW5_MYTED|nr:unnamed protein product [Mytilus edulis]
MVGGRKPVCDSEGNYAPKQCSGSQCYCVKEDGKEIEDFSVNRWEAEQQTCKCARSQAEYKETGMMGKSFRCTADGSYDEVQCTGSQCYCADEDGQQIGNLETTGLGRNSDIIQIAAKSYSNSFNRYVIPRVDIQIEASKITGITYSHGTNKMYVRGQIVEPVSLHKALLDFIHFLKEQNQPIILGHNICNFDIPVIVNKLKEYNLFSTFCETVKGFIDTMKVARKYIPKHDVENFKQQTLVKQFVGENYLAHNAIEDVDSLKTLYDSKLALLVKSDDVFAISYHNCMDSYSGLLSSKIVSRPVCMQLAKDGISLKHLKLASVRDVNGLKFVLQDHKIPPKSVKMHSGLLSD